MIISLAFEKKMTIRININDEFKWEQVSNSDKSPPIGKILSINYFDNNHIDKINFGFYTKTETTEKDFDVKCLNILKGLCGEDSFYIYDKKKGFSQPVSRVISWASHTNPRLTSNLRIIK